MIFRSKTITAQWDTWCYYHEGTYYAYYLITETSPGEGFGVASSTDGVHWHDHGLVIAASDKMVHFLGTGSVWPDPKQPGRFLCNYSEHRLDGTGQRRQCILFAWSDDLIHWTKFDDYHIFWINEDHYERCGRWDCIFALPRAEGGYWGTWTATPSGRTDANGGIGIGYSDDGLHWTALPAPTVIPDADESGAMTVVDKHIHAMFGSFGTGMLAYGADSLQRPFTQPHKNALLLGSNHAYFSRYFDTPDGVLINHHAMDGSTAASGRAITYLAPFKKLSIDDEGIQRWLWWSGNERMKASTPCANGHGDFQTGVILQGTLRPVNDEGCDILFSVDELTYAIHVEQQKRVTFLRYDPAQQTWATLQSVDRQLPAACTWDFRLLARRGVVEFYLGDYFMECCALGCPDGQRFSHKIETASDTLASTQIWEMTLE